MNKEDHLRPAWFVRGDLDGFCGLFIDNLLQLMLITVLCRYACGFPAAFISERILPGAAISILIGNLFYAWQGRRLARATGRLDVTALPFGINTVSLLAFIFLVMSPVFFETGDAELAWKAGVGACVLSGLIETAGAFVGDWLKRHTPRAALLSGLGGVALSFLALGFSLQIFSSPAVALIPMFLLLIFYGAKVRLPLRLPGGVVAIAIGTILAWTLKWTNVLQLTFPDDPVRIALHWPVPAMGEVFSIFLHPRGWSFLAVVIPMGLFNVISSIQNLESAEAAGDKFKTRPSLLANGITSLIAGALGSPFPTTIYMGHPGWKSMGARTGYSVLNGTVIALMCLLGGVNLILKVVPIEVTLGMLIWVGLVIVAQAFIDTDRRHAVAVVLGFIPPLAAWLLHVIETCLRAAETSLYESIHRIGGELYIHGVISLYQGFLLIAIMLSAILAHIIDRKFLSAAAWSFVGALLSAFGIIHSYQLTPSGIQGVFKWWAAPEFAGSYLAIGGALVFVHILTRRSIYGSVTEINSRRK